MDDNQLPPGLAAFLAVAEAGSFTGAAAQLGVSPSAVSQQVRALERHLGASLLQWTTRSLRLTEAGERYRSVVGPAFAAVRDATRVLDEDGGEPSGMLRLTLPRTAYQALLRPVLPRFLARHPRVRIELSVDNALVDIVRDGFDAGIRFGDVVHRDMVAIRIGPSMRVALLASPGYLDARGRPSHPRDLAGHDCVGFRSATTGRVEAWRLRKGSEKVRFTPSGPSLSTARKRCWPRRRTASASSSTLRASRQRSHGTVAWMTYWTNGVRTCLHFTSTIPIAAGPAGRCRRSARC